jgi:uncharacterized protein DUF4150
MPSTVNANMMSTVHAGSTGIAASFPDVCKTPAPPAPFVPIPYPNIAQSSDTSQGSTTVKCDGNPIMLEGSTFSMSSGDEAGSAGGGMVSSKIKGKAEFTMHSFDVKADGKGVPRLLDPMQTNEGSPANSMNPAEAQAVIPAVPIVNPMKAEACEKTKENEKKTDTNPATVHENSGIISDHQTAIQKYLDKNPIHVLVFRRTNPKCGKWIQAKHQPKPHSCLDGKTITWGNASSKAPNAPSMGECVSFWLDRHEMRKKSTLIGKVAGLIGERPPPYPDVSSIPTAALSGMFEGIVMATAPADDIGKPLKWVARKYRGKWMTGDYDLYDVQRVGNECIRPNSDPHSKENTEWCTLMIGLNKAMGWDGIQHGPQAHWVPTKKEIKGASRTDWTIPEELKKWLNEKTISKDVPTVPISATRNLPVIDDRHTTFKPGTTVTYLNSLEDVKASLICQGCAD